MQILQNETHKIYDSSRLTSLMTCPRKYFYRYELGWRSEGTSHPLVYGSAFHEAKEIMFKAHQKGIGYDDASIEPAFDGFMKIYRKDFDEESDMSYGAKTPGYLKKVLLDYITQYQDVDRNMKVIDTEISGFAPLGYGNKIFYRLDAVIQTNLGILILDHKTTAMDSSTWDASWMLDFQMGTYIHAAKCLFGKEAWGAIIDATVLRKSGSMHKRIPLMRTPQSLESWLFDCRSWLAYLKAQKNILFKKDSAKARIMKSFPRITLNCTKWNRRCPYFDFCQAWSNPLHVINDDGTSATPPGMLIEFWNPLVREKDEKKNDDGTSTTPSGMLREFWNPLIREKDEKKIDKAN